MKLIKNLYTGLRYRRWTVLETFAYFLKGLARETNFLKKPFYKFHLKVQEQKYTKIINSERVIDFKGILLPNIYTDISYANVVPSGFDESFFIFMYFNDDYNPQNFHYVEKYLKESPYCYTDWLETFDVTVQENDVVIDAGAWIGEFSAYAAFKNAQVYAFEPLSSTYEILKKTAALNKNIVPVEYGLSDSAFTSYLQINSPAGHDNSVIAKEEITDEHIVQEIRLTTIDDFVRENNLQKVNFIKADIEGYERFMLLGAKETLRKFAPKLAICTYHLPDDKEILRDIILEANPNYRIIQKYNKLFAQV